MASSQHSDPFERPANRPVDARLASLRQRGYRGLPIRIHRAFRTIPHTPARLIRSGILAVVLTVVWLLLRPTVARFWAAILETGCRWLGLPSAVRILETQGFFFRNGTPEVTVVGNFPDMPVLVSVGVITAIVAIGSLFLPSRMIPVTYIVRAFCLIQATSVFYFAYFPSYFQHSLPGYVATMLASSMAFISSVPAILAFTFFIFDFALLRKLMLGVLLMLHLAILAPFQYLIHLFLISKFTLVVMPPIYIMFGLLVQVTVFIAFYAWGMSWTSREDEQPW